MNKKLNIVCFVLLFSCSAFGQKKPSVAASVDKPAILIGEPLELRLSAEFNNPSAVSFFHIDSIPHFEVVQQAKIDTQQSGTNLRLSQRIMLISWDSGKWKQPAFTLAHLSVKTKPVNT